MANLPTFAVILVLMIAVVRWFVNLVHGGSVSNRDSIINNKDSEIALLKSQRDEYKNKLSGATPDEAKARVDVLEGRAISIIGLARWLGSLGRLGWVIRISGPRPGVLSNPLARVMLRNKALDYFRFAIGP